jgi:DNA (cytosine-5)-methyltransferase 1
MTQNGQAYELPTPVLPITDSESSSLPTPTTQDNSGKCRDHGGDLLHDLTCGCSRADRRVKLPTPIFGTVTTATSGRSAAFRKGANPTPQEFADEIAASMLPTPTVFHTTMHDEPIEYFLEREERSSTGQIGKSLGVAFRMEMLPTPVASEGYKAPSQQTSETKAKTGQVWLSNTAKDMEQTWGRFEPAIRRWETVLGRPAPAPTNPDGKDGNHRLSSKFTEWMMGLPEGWITDAGLTRNEELKACGNGVVPQQAELALRMLLK